MSVTLRFCGAARTVTGSCHLFETPAGRVLVDCGMFQGPKTLKELNYDAFPFHPEDITAVLLTHAHIDHSGLIPKLVRGGFRGPVWATQGTIDLCSFMLPDSGGIQESEVAYLNRRNAARGRPQVTPIYTQRDAVASLDSFRPVEYEKWFEAMSGVRARYWNAGHLLGSASIEIEFAGQGKDGKPLRVLASGDIGPDAKLLEPDPEAPTGLDYVLSESTYGNRDRPAVTRESRREVLAKEVRAALSLGGALLIPAFAVERTQELIVDLVDLMQRGDVPEAPIFLDSPLAIHATEVFREHTESLESDVNVERLLNSPRLRCTEIGGGEQGNRQAHRLPHHHRGQRHVRCRPHPPSSQALALARQGDRAALRLPGAGHARPLPGGRRQGSSHPGRSRSRWRRASASSTNIPAMPTGRNWRAGSPGAGRSPAASSWCTAKNAG